MGEETRSNDCRSKLVLHGRAAKRSRAHRRRKRTTEVQLEGEQMTTRLEGMRMALCTLEKRPLVIAHEVGNLVRLNRYSEGSERLPRREGGCYSRLGSRSRDASLASELKHNLLERGRLMQMQNDIATQQGRVDVDASPAQTENIGSNLDLKRRVVLGGGFVHVGMVVVA